MTARTLFDKIWDRHVVCAGPEGSSILYIDLHLVHEVTSPQAFEGLRQAKRKVRRPDLTFATLDHNIPTTGNRMVLEDALARTQVEALRKNCREFGVPLFDLDAPEQGIVHVIGPELGLTQPGMTIVCGDSHTSTHGAFGALAFGIGTSEVEHVLATQCLVQKKPKSMLVRFTGTAGAGVTAKDLILALIAQIGIDGATGHVIEYAGDAIRALSMEARMTVCNMSIEGGARAGMIAPDQTTFDYLKGRRFAPQGEAWEKAMKQWATLQSDPGAKFDATVDINAAQIAPFVTWGTNPGMAAPVTGEVPGPRPGRKRFRAQQHCAGAGIYGTQPAHAHCRYCRGPRVHRLMHQCAAGRYPQRGAGGEGLQNLQERAGNDCSRLATGEAGGGTGRTAPHLYRSRL